MRSSDNPANNFVADRWMLPEDAPVAFNRKLNAGSATGAINRDAAFDKMVQEANTPLDQGFDAVAPTAAPAQ